MFLMSGKAATLTKTLEELQVYQTILSGEDSFKATLKPISYDSRILITTKIEMVSDCPTWETVTNTNATKEAVCLIAIEDAD